MAEINPETRMITLQSSDEKNFEIQRDAIRRAVTIETLITDLNMDDPAVEDQVIPLPDVDSATLERVIKYCNQNAENPILTGNEEEDNITISDSDSELLDIDAKPLYDLVIAANYLDIKCLLKKSCRTVASYIRGKPVKEMRRIFKIENDYTDEEEDQIKKENAWCELPDN